MDSDTRSMFIGLLRGLAGDTLPKGKLAEVISHIEMEAGDEGKAIVMQALSVRGDPRDVPDAP